MNVEKFNSFNYNVQIFPAEEEFLDEKLVNNALSFLPDNASSHFNDSLSHQLKETNKDYVKTCDSIRRTLEEYLRSKLNNTKGLQKNISVLRQTLKDTEINNDVRRNIMSAINGLDSFFNENGKHKDGSLTEADSEYVIYQTSTIMRFIDQTIKSPIQNP